MAGLEELVDEISTFEVYQHKKGLPPIVNGSVVIGEISWNLQRLATMIEREKKRFDTLCEGATPDKNEYREICDLIDYLTKEFWRRVEKEIPLARQLQPLYLGQYWHIAFRVQV